MKKTTQALIGINFATFLFGFVGVLAKSINLNTGLIIWGRCLLASIVLLIFILVFKHSLKFKKKIEYLYVFILGILLFGHWITFFYAMRVSTVAIGTIAMFTFPVITVFLEPLIMKQKLKLYDVLSGGLVLIGISFLIPTLDIHNNITLGVLSGTASAILYSLRNIYTKKLLIQYSSVTLMFYQVLTAAICLSPLLFIYEFKPQQMDLILLFVLGTVFTALPHTLLVNSLQYLKAKTMSITTSTQLIYAIIIAAIFLAEIPDLKTIIGGTIILLSVIFETFKGHEEEAITS